ncbi:MAG: electron transfer flavoprotein subunit beta/FixA family protein [Thermodesulfobacteriota bacterium]|nr:electron transfer flavoprotein subunit beta/FixA family protein [Thermodesulfobacteriota bacterium]
MRIIVPIKQVPETNAVKMDEVTGTMIREGVEAIINPLDLYAIEIAIRLRESYGGEVIAISMGPAKAMMALREAIAMGIDQAVLISDKSLAGSDTWATSYALAAAIKRLTNSPDDPGRNSLGLADWGGGFDLILCGERATDGDTGQVGPGIASFLNLPIGTYIGKIEQIGNGICRVHRLIEDGYEILELHLPALLTVVKEIANPRLPTLRGKQKAKKVQIPIWGPDQLQVQANQVGLQGSPTRVVKIFRPKVARQGQKVLATDERTISEAADHLVKFLQQKDML